MIKNQVHDALVAATVQMMVKTVMTTGGKTEDVMAVACSVLVTTMLVCVEPGRDEQAVEAVANQLREHLKIARKSQADLNAKGKP